MRQQTADNKRQRADSRQQIIKFCRLSFAIRCLTYLLLSTVCYLSAIAVAQDSPSPMRFDDASRVFSDQFGQTSTNNGKLLPKIVCMVAGIAFILILAERYYRSRNTKNGYYSHNRLFRELCQAHELTKEQQTILWNIARELQLKNPAVLFIEPKHLELALTESVVHSSQESIRKIFYTLFSRNAFSSDSSHEENNTWFAWTKVINNPEADLLKKESKKEQDKRDDFNSSSMEQTQQWDPSLWQELRRAIDQNAGQKMKALEIAPVTQESDQTVKEKSGYKPRYPETQDALVHQSPGGQVSSSVGDQKTAPSQTSLPQTPPSPGAQILSSMLYSVSDVTNELTYSSIRNHLTRSLSLRPQTLGEMKQRIPDTTPSISLDEIMISPQKPFRQSDTQTQVETKTEPKVVIKQIELKSIDLKRPKPFLDERE